jgi:predicted small lipoprotein YifL
MIGRTMIGRIAVLAVALTALAACGKEGDPTLKPGQSDTYPQTYPRGSAGSEPNILRSRTPRRGLE